MDWASLVGFALLLTISIIVLRLLWYWFIILMALGPATFAGIVVGGLVGPQLESVGAGLLAAVVVAGLLIEAVRSALRRTR